MKGSCRPCNSVFIGEEEEGEGEEGGKSSSAVPWVRTVATGVDLPCENRRDGHGSRLANGAGHHKEGSHESKRGPQDSLLELERTRYTSLKDLLPLPALRSPTARPQGREITIRNRLVKQAAYAYLQPAGASSPGSSSSSRGCLQWLRWEAEGCLGFLGARIIPAVRRTFGRLLAGLRRRTVRDR